MMCSLVEHGTREEEGSGTVLQQIIQSEQPREMSQLS